MRERLQQLEKAIMKIPDLTGAQLAKVTSLFFNAYTEDLEARMDALDEIGSYLSTLPSSTSPHADPNHDQAFSAARIRLGLRRPQT